jgi:hypothetical protein
MNHSVVTPPDRGADAAGQCAVPEAAPSRSEQAAGRARSRRGCDGSDSEALILYGPPSHVLAKHRGRRQLSHGRDETVIKRSNWHLPD